MAQKKMTYSEQLQKWREPTDNFFGAKLKDRLCAVDITMAALTDGKYKTREGLEEGVEVNIQDAIKKCVEESKLFTPAQLEELKVKKYF